MSEPQKVKNVHSKVRWLGFYSVAQLITTRGPQATHSFGDRVCDFSTPIELENTQKKSIGTGEHHIKPKVNQPTKKSGQKQKQKKGRKTCLLTDFFREFLRR